MMFVLAFGMIVWLISIICLIMTISIYLLKGKYVDIGLTLRFVIALISFTALQILGLGIVLFTRVNTLYTDAITSISR